MHSEKSLKDFGSVDWIGKDKDRFIYNEFGKCSICEKKTLLFSAWPFEILGMVCLPCSFKLMFICYFLMDNKKEHPIIHLYNVLSNIHSKPINKSFYDKIEDPNLGKMIDTIWELSKLPKCLREKFNSEEKKIVEILKNPTVINAKNEASKQLKNLEKYDFGKIDRDE